MKIFNLPDELHTQVYLPESQDDCHIISCANCICLSHRIEGSPCQFNVYLSQHQVEMPTDTDEQPKAKPKHRGLLSTPNEMKEAVKQMAKSCKCSVEIQDQRSAQDILNMCATLQANTMQAQVEPLQNMVNVLDLIIEITEKQDELTQMRQEQPVPEHQEDRPSDSKMATSKYWKLVKVYECPDCGAWAQDIDGVCNHVCKEADPPK